MTTPVPGRPGGPPTLVVLRALGLGDALTALPALRALTDAFPGHRRVVAAPAHLAPLLVEEGGMDEVADHRGLSALDPGLDRPDVAVDLHGRGPGSQPLLLALRPRRLIAFAHPDIPETLGGPRWRPGEHEVSRWCRLLCESGIPADPRRLSIASPATPGSEWPEGPEGWQRPKWREGSGGWQGRQWSESPGITVIHPGAASGARRWPPRRFALVAGAEVRKGRRVVVTGSAAERPLAEEIAERAGLGPPAVRAGDTDLSELIALVAAAGRVVSGDTGVAHLATALGTPSVVLFGPVPPSEWGPPPGSARHVALWAGRRGDPHAEDVDAGLMAITVEEVLAALDTLPDPWSKPDPVPTARAGGYRR
ncbi:MAG: glycosyltransferase family 9 protein [Acidobacteriota bacterium]|nr:glycosyltransferase family 9 protein [Acidobacteriota bacterium]